MTARFETLARCCRLAAALAVAVLALAPGCVGAAGAARPFVVQNVRVFDGRAVLPAADVVVRDGKIAAVGTHLAVPAGAEVIDGRGETLLPGLIDAHVHTWGDALHDALAFGVTTELDMFSDYGLDAAMRAEQAAGKGLDRADLFSAGTLATAPGGHGTEYGVPIPTVRGPADAQGFVDARIAEGSDYIKIVYDDGKTYGLAIPTISRETLKALVDAAHKRGKLAVVHIGSDDGARDAIAAGADGLAHLFVDRRPEADFGRFAAAHHAFVVPTLTVLQSVSHIPGGAALAKDPLLNPYLSVTNLGHLEAGFPKHASEVPPQYAAAEEAVRLLAAAHVPILAGTDAPNPGTATGVSLHEELALLVHAGLTPIAALTAATAAPAAAFHLGDRGRIAPGLRADLLLVHGDPTVDVHATRDIARIWKLGVPFDRAAFRAMIEEARTAQVLPPATMPASGLVSDFDDGTTRATFGSGWHTSTDQLVGGKSQVTLSTAEGDAGKGRALAISGTIATGFAYPWAGAMFYPGAKPMAPANLAAKKAVRFRAKGDGKTYRVMIFTQGGGSAPLIATVAGDAEWKEHIIPFSTFGPVDGHDLTGLLFSGGPQIGPFSLWIDDVSFE